jgi:arginine-tRNA-protein transferase
LDGDPPELLVYDELTACPYLPERQARLPMRLPVRPLTPDEFEARLVGGDRRQGLLLYNPTCPSCEACQPIRLDVAQFRPSQTQRRVFRKGEAALTTEIGQPELSDEKVALYNRHKHGRKLLGEGDPIDVAGYSAFLVDTCTDTFEIRYKIDGDLMALAIVDRSSNALSAVYTYFDPIYSSLSPGVFSILKQVELARKWGLQYVYLGLYVGDCAAMAYKSAYRPHQRRIDGRWQSFTD